MWSIYDTVILLGGVFTAAIAAIPVKTIPAKTRIIAGVIGGVLVLASLYTGSLDSFTYPSAIFALPVVALVAAGVIAKNALDATKQYHSDVDPGGMGVVQYGAQGHFVGGPAASPTLAPQSGVVENPYPITNTEQAAQAGPSTPAEAVPNAQNVRESAWAQLFQPDTSPQRLAEIAASYPEFSSQIGAHPNAYPELKAWAAQMQRGNPL